MLRTDFEPIGQTETHSDPVEHTVNASVSQIHIQQLQHYSTALLVLFFCFFPCSKKKQTKTTEIMTACNYTGVVAMSYDHRGNAYNIIIVIMINFGMTMMPTQLSVGVAIVLPIVFTLQES